MPKAQIVSAPQWVKDGGLLNVNEMRPIYQNKQDRILHNALLRKDEWEDVDAEVIRVAKQRLVGIQDLTSRGLVRQLGGLGTILSTYEQLSDMSPAEINMSGETAGEEDTQGFNPISIPVPITHKDFRINIRRLEASRRLGDDLEVTQVATATRLVSEALEGLLFNGTGAPTVDGNTIYGYTTLPARDTDTATNYGGGDFGTEENPYDTISGMITELNKKGYYGPFGVYVATTQYGQMRGLLSGRDVNEIQAIQENFDEIEFLRSSSKLADGNVVVVQLTTDVVDIAIARDIVPVQWVTMGGMVSHFKVMGALVPRLKYDDDGNAGIAHATGA